MFGKGSHVWAKVLIRPDKLVSQAFFLQKSCGMRLFILFFI